MSILVTFYIDKSSEEAMNCCSAPCFQSNSVYLLSYSIYFYIFTSEGQILHFVLHNIYFILLDTSNFDLSDL